MNKIFVIAGAVIRELVRRKDFYFILALLLVLILFASSASFGGESGFERFFKEIGITLAFSFSVLIAISFAARQIPEETESRTIYVLLTHPISRFQFILGKFLGVFLVAVISFSVFYLVLIASLLLRSDHNTPALLLAEGYLLHAALLAFMTSLTLLLSLFMSTMANTAISLIIYFGAVWFGANIQGYIFLPHPELLDIKDRLVHSVEVIPAWVIGSLVAYAAAYDMIFLTLAYLVFRKRNL